MNPELNSPSAPGASAPLALPALGFVLGAGVASSATWLSLPLLTALVVFGLALRSRMGRVVAAFAAGVLVAMLRGDLPSNPLSSLDLDRPVEAVATIVGHWSPEEEGWMTTVEITRLVQDERGRALRLSARLFLPGSQEPPPLGTTIRALGYLRRSARYANRLGTPAGPWRLAVESRLLMAIERPPGVIAALSGSLRGRVDRAFAESARWSSADQQDPSTGLALARALVLGDATDLPISWKRGLRRAGLAHLWSVSGLHLAMVAGIALLVSFRLRGGWRYLPTLAAIVGYLLLVGPLPPLVRAAAMAALAVLALSSDRPPAPLNALALVTILLVGHRPELARDLSLQLTLAATAGLIALAPQFERRWSFEVRSRAGRLAHGLIRALAASLGAEIATLPFALPAFHLLSLAAPIWNLVAIPWTTLALGTSLLWTTLALVSPELAGFILPLLDGIAAPFGWPARLPVDGWTSIPLDLGTVAATALACGLGGLLVAETWRIRFGSIALIVLSLSPFGSQAVRPLGSLETRSDPEMTLFDVGQGDAMLLRDGARAVLVDGGGWRSGDFGGRVLLPALLGEGVRKLDAAILTHGDRDHCGGLVDIASYVPLREVWLAREPPGVAREGCAAELAATPGVEVRTLAAGDRARVGRFDLRVLWPRLDEPIVAGNERSLVLRAEANGGSVLLTGDIGERAEIGLFVESEREIAADVLKVAHHGSRGSSLGLFLDAVAPRFAIVSAGPANPYGHPAPETLARLKARSIGLLRTDLQGAVHLRFRPAGRITIELPGEK